MARRNYLRISDTGTIESVFENYNPVRVDDQRLAQLFGQTVTIPLKYDANATVGVGIGTRIVVIKVPTVNISTYWGVGKDAETGVLYLTPVFRQLNGSVSAVKTWELPKELGFFLMVQYPSNGDVPNLYAVCDIIQPNNEKGRRRLFLPNIYDHGLVCVGSGFYDWWESNEISVRDASLHEVVENAHKVVTQFQSSNWNADLLSNEIKTLIHRYVRFDPETDKQIPVGVGNDVLGLPPLAGEVFDWLPFSNT